MKIAEHHAFRLALSMASPRPPSACLALTSRGTSQDRTTRVLCIEPKTFVRTFVRERNAEKRHTRFLSYSEQAMRSGFQTATAAPALGLAVVVSALTACSAPEERRSPSTCVDCEPEPQ